MTDRILEDGYSTIVSFDGGDLAVAIKEVKPFGFSGGGGNNQTTFNNVAYRTQLPKKLTDITDMTLKVAYRSSVQADIIAQRQVNQEIQIRFADGTGWGVYGWIEEFDPQTVKEGEQPEANMMLKASNIDPETGEEAGPWELEPLATTTT